MIKKNEKGFALVLSLVLLLVMSLMGGALIVVSSGDHQSNNSSDQYQQAFYVAETGLLEAEKAIINKYMGPYVEIKQDTGELDDEGNSIKITTHARDFGNRGMPTNETDLTETECSLSFKNLDRPSGETLKVTGQATNQKFYDLISPIFPSGDKTEAINVDAIASGEQIQKEKDFLRRFRYEFFSINVGTATYYGSGASIKKKSSDSQSQGTAYKIYACGIMTESKSSNVAEIIIPLESLIVMPN